MMLHQFSQEGYAVHSRHFQIERKNIRLKRQYLVPRYEGVGCGSDDFYTLVLTQLPAEYLADYGRIVDYQDFNIGVESKRHISSS